MHFDSEPHRVTAVSCMLNSTEPHIKLTKLMVSFESYMTGLTSYQLVDLERLSMDKEV